MIKVLQKILLLVAVITVTGHSILPHFHHDEIPATINHHHEDEEQPAGKHHHDDDNTKDNQHSLFSFVQLDENFVPAKGQVKTFELPVEYLPVVITFLSSKFSASTKTHYGWYREYPPPDDYWYISSLRGPPIA